MIILLTGQESIRDVILFPFMKPEKEEGKVDGKNKN
jgi:aspartyl-tRNA synthetase